MLLSLNPNIIIRVENNVVSLFSSTSTSSQKVRKCGGYSLLDRILVNFFSGVAQVCRDAAGKMMLHPNIIVHVEM